MKQPKSLISTPSKYEETKNYEKLPFCFLI
jgi:hypothetical protein